MITLDLEFVKATGRAETIDAPSLAEQMQRRFLGQARPADSPFPPIALPAAGPPGAQTLDPKPRAWRHRPHGPLQLARAAASQHAERARPGLLAQRIAGTSPVLARATPGRGEDLTG